MLYQVLITVERKYQIILIGTVSEKLTLRETKKQKSKFSRKMKINNTNSGTGDPTYQIYGTLTQTCLLSRMPGLVRVRERTLLIVYQIL